MVINKKFKWWWAWDCEKVENWIEQMSEQGNQLLDVSNMGTVFHYTPGNSVKIRCCIDYWKTIKWDYIQLAADDGWTYFPMGAGWHLFIKSYTEERPEWFSDVDSLIERNNRLINLLGLCGVPFLTLAATSSNLLADKFPFTHFIILICSVLLSFGYIYSLSMLLARKKTLKLRKEWSGK